MARYLEYVRVSVHAPSACGFPSGALVVLTAVLEQLLRQGPTLACLVLQLMIGVDYAVFHFEFNSSPTLLFKFSY